MNRFYLVKLYSKIIFFVCSFLCFSNQCFAHTASGMESMRTLACLAAVEDFFQRTYGYTLHEEVHVHVAKSSAEYRARMSEWPHDPSLDFAKDAVAVTSENHCILVNGAKIQSEAHFYFVLSHEMVHKFQYEYVSNPHSDYVMLEGQADVIASLISGYPIDIVDHGIPYNQLMSRDQFFAAVQKNRVAVIEQIRFYAARETLGKG